MRRFGYLIFCAILVVSIPGLSLASNKIIKVGIYQNKPKVFIDSAGEPQGFFIDILNYIASKEGWQLDYVVSTWEKNLEKLETAEIDLLLDIAESEARTELFDFNKEIIFSNWAIIYVQKESIHLVILALNMPGMGGRKCLDRMLEIKPELKTIVTSGNTPAANFKTVCHGGNAVFVEEPYQIEDLLRIIRQVLDHHP